MEVRVNYREWFYISNLLSVARVVLLVPLFLFFELETITGNYLAVATILLAGITDFFDGRLARKYGQTSDLGRVLDPIADKVCVAVTALMLMKWRDMPAWYVILLVARDLGILLLGVLLVAKTKVVVESNMIGKVTVGALAIVLIAYTLDLEAMKVQLLWISLGFVALSSISYLLKMVKLIRS